MYEATVRERRPNVPPYIVCVVIRELWASKCEISHGLDMYSIRPNSIGDRTTLINHLVRTLDIQQTHSRRLPHNAPTCRLPFRRFVVPPALLFHLPIPAGAHKGWP